MRISLILLLVLSSPVMAIPSYVFQADAGIYDIHLDAPIENFSVGVYDLAQYTRQLLVLDYGQTDGSFTVGSIGITSVFGGIFVLSLPRFGVYLRGNAAEGNRAYYLEDGNALFDGLSIPSAQQIDRNAVPITSSLFLALLGLAALGVSRHGII